MMLRAGLTLKAARADVAVTPPANEGIIHSRAGIRLIMALDSEKEGR